MSGPAWKSACDHGAFMMIVRTRAEAVAGGFPVHPEAQFLGEVRPDDDRPTIHVGFASLEGLREFIAGMEPRAVWTTDPALCAVIERGGRDHSH